MSKIKTHPPLVTITFDEQIAHLEEYRDRFKEHQCHSGDGLTGDVRGYMEDSDNDDDNDYGFGATYMNMCSDLGIEPRGLIDNE